ncbi:hypothetical protein Gogos_004554 [Gossypium gossypioides]|uniref:Pollen-specific protein SF21 n=1 Tax=Gossypium gossypioides TaxID=34282 RepID=A0A7J9CGT0_GOSGO|nr:hypothetical protein [Gossypium gossypioides]
MADSSDSISIDTETISLVAKEYLVKTRCGMVSVAVFGDLDKPALVTYPDLALNHISCFQGLFFSPEVNSFLLHNFCIYHISPPGHEVAAAPIGSDDLMPSVDDLADQVLEMKYRQRVLGLILVSPLCRAPSWTEWLLNKVMSNLLYFYGMCGVVKELLLKRYFSQEVRGSVEEPESDIVQACRRMKGRVLSVQQFLEAMNGRRDLSEGLRKLHCRSLIFVGENSPFHSEALHMTSKLDRRYSALVEVQACGSIVTEEQPHAMLIPLEYFLMGFGLYRPTLSVSPRSPLSPTCISPELLSPESMGLKLKPIKTRIS